MALEQQIMAEMKDAMKAKDEAALRGLRAIKAEIIKAKTEPGAGGEIDEATEQKFLQKMMKQRSGEGSPVQLNVYKGAHHAFDAPEFKTGFEAYGHWIEYNAIAADQSVNDVHAFLRGAFGN